MSISSGKYGEKIALDYLINNGYKIIEKNFRTKYGEIDIIAEKDNFIIFVEVKYRTNPNFGKAEESITKRKLEKIRKVAGYFLKNFKVKNKRLRIDVIAINDFNNVKLTHYKNVFF